MSIKATCIPLSYQGTFCDLLCACLRIYTVYLKSNLLLQLFDTEKRKIYKKGIQYIISVKDGEYSYDLQGKYILSLFKDNYLKEGSKDAK